MFSATMTYNSFEAELKTDTGASGVAGMGRGGEHRSRGKRDAPFNILYDGKKLNKTKLRSRLRRA